MESKKSLEWNWENILEQITFFGISKRQSNQSSKSKSNYSLTRSHLVFHNKIMSLLRKKSLFNNFSPETYLYNFPRNHSLSPFFVLSLTKCQENGNKITFSATQPRIETEIKIVNCLFVYEIPQKWRLTCKALAGILQGSAVLQLCSVFHLIFVIFR